MFPSFANRRINQASWKTNREWFHNIVPDSCVQNQWNASSSQAWYPRTIAGGVFLPCVEGDIAGAALPFAPSENTYVSKDISYMAGINMGEGAFLAECEFCFLCTTWKLISKWLIMVLFLDYRSDNKTLFDELGMNYDRLLPIVLALNSRTSFNQRSALGKKIKQYYFGNETIANNVPTALALMEVHITTIETSVITRNFSSILHFDRCFETAYLGFQQLKLWSRYRLLKCQLTCICTIINSTVERELNATI